MGGHFAFLALGRACGGTAVEGLRFLNEETGFEGVKQPQLRSSGDSPFQQTAPKEGVRGVGDGEL